MPLFYKCQRGTVPRHNRKKDLEMTTITVKHFATDTDLSRSVDTIYSGEMTPRRLARAVAIASKEFDDYRRLFGPGVIYPAHHVGLFIDDVEYDFADMIAAKEDGYGYHNDGPMTWTEIAAQIHHFERI